jgi:hypothetical protein
MLGDTPGVPDQPYEFSVPVLLNTNEASLVVELQCQGLLATDAGDAITGIQIERVLRFTVEVLERFEQTTPFPEFVFDARLVVALTDERWQQVADDRYANRPFQLEILRES